MMKAQTIAAAGLLLTLRVHGQNVIFSGTGFGTYYYDIQQVDACDTSFATLNMGQLECSLETVLTLDQVNLDYVVAMNRTQLSEDMDIYCGKQVIVSVNGQPSSLPLFIGDGCVRCANGSASSDTWDPNGSPGLDFSYTVLSELSSSACADGHIDITWEIVDETLYNFDTNGSGTPQGPVAALGSRSTTPTSASAPSNVNPNVVPATLATWARPGLHYSN